MNGYRLPLGVRGPKATLRMLRPGVVLHGRSGARSASR
jgi:hypothetical protein